MERANRFNGLRKTPGKEMQAVDRVGSPWADPEVAKLNDLRVGDMLSLYNGKVCEVVEIMKSGKIRVEYISETEHGRDEGDDLLEPSLSVIKFISPAARPKAESSRYFA